MRALPLAVAGLSVVTSALPAAQLPKLNIDPSSVTVGGISSGADYVAQFAVAFSDILRGSAIYAGQPFLCAVTRFPNEQTYSCSEEAAMGLQGGPGCVGYADALGCNGCDPGSTLLYDHCKLPASQPGFVNVSMLASSAVAAAAAGAIAPVTNLARHRTYLYRGTLDSVYLDGAVNKTADFFLHFASSPEQVKFVADIPSQHAQPSADPWLGQETCGRNLPGWPPAMANCAGYDGAGDALQHMYDGTLSAPPALNFTHPEYLTQFEQTVYMPAAWPGLSSVGYVYIPPPCSSGALCKLHLALHGCGMSMWTPSMNNSFVSHAGFNPWALANNMVILYPQGGGFLEQGRAAPSAQLQAGCFDSYGQTGPDYAYKSGLQMATLRAMITAVAGI